MILHRWVRCVAARRFAAIAIVLCFACGEVSAQLRIVTYNTATGQAGSSGQKTARPDVSTVLEAIGLESKAGIAKPIDVLLLQEQYSMAISAQSVVDMLNDIYGPGTYARSQINGATSSGGEGGRPGLVYNTETVELLAETSFGNVSGSAQARATLRYKLRPVGYDSPEAEFYVYNNHYKASTGASNEARRLIEAQGIRNNSDALGQGVHLIYAGDFNMQSSSEAAYQELLSSGNGEAFDPINAPGNWHNSNSLRYTHTQSPASSQQYSGQVTGGVDDRFDFQLVSGEWMDGEGLAYISGTYRAFGNNGTHSCCNSAITTGSGASSSVLTALTRASDHLPVVADYQIPARVQVDVDAVPPRVIVGSPVAIDFSVVNSAPVSFSNGADELDYSAVGSGALTGSASGSVDALAAGDDWSFNVDTSTAGTHSATLQVTTSSQGAANASFLDAISIDVLDHGNASFNPLTDENIRLIEFGQVTVGSEILTDSFQLFNLEQAAGYTADLDFTGSFPSGDADRLSADFDLFTGLAAGEASNHMQVSFDTSELGTFATSYSLFVSDEAIPGASTEVLTLVLTGEVIQDVLTGDYNLDGMVDAADYTVWRNSLGLEVASGTMADGNGSGVIDLGDYQLWKQNFGSTNAANLTVVQVPESGSAMICAGLLMSYLAVNRKVRMRA